MTLTQDLHQRAQGLITRRLGLDFSHKRERDLERGLHQAVKASSHATLETYLDWLARQPEENPEWIRLAGYLTVGETYFFRDRFCFDALEHRVLLPLIETRRASGWRQLRIWSAGCATGEEPHSFAMLLDRLLPDRHEWTLTILASDINPEALHAARLGRYRGWSLRATPAAVRDRYFRPHGSDTFELDRGIREMVTFTPLNLAHEGYPAPMTNTNAMDVIFCRNVLMYFTPEAQRAVAGRLHQALVPEGWLAVSPAEATAELWEPLQPVNFPGTIFFRKTALTSRPPTPT
ncbi:MAG: CheR family methyltransferase, partial [Nitrospirales bacterium]